MQSPRLHADALSSWVFLVWSPQLIVYRHESGVDPNDRRPEVFELKRSNERLGEHDALR
jgi:hypothetical protein